MTDASYMTTHQFPENPKELLYLIIQKAKRSGFEFKNFIDQYDSFIITSFNPETGRMAFVLRNDEEMRVVYDSIYILFFDVCFARALFGAEWEKRLIELAGVEDKLEYLINNILITELYA